jgi:hypothetical protein
VVHRRLNTCRGWPQRRCRCPWRGLGHRWRRRRRGHRWRRRWCEPRRRQSALVDAHWLGEACRRDRRFRGRRRGHRGPALVDPHRLCEAGRRGRYRRPRRRCSPATPARPGGGRRGGRRHQRPHRRCSPATPAWPGGGRRRGPAERRHHRTRARHRAGSSTDRRRASTCRERKYRWLDHRVSRKESEEVKVRVGGGWCGGGGVGKHGLIKHHMARDEDPARGEVKAAVALVVRGVPEKHTEGGTGC